MDCVRAGDGVSRSVPAETASSVGSSVHFSVDKRGPRSVPTETASRVGSSVHCREETS